MAPSCSNRWAAISRLRSRVDQEGHGALPGYLPAAFDGALWPAILFVVPGIGLAVTRRAEPGIRFLMAWAGSWWLIVEAVPTKLPNYALPAYPALAILAALWLLAPKQEEGWRRWLAFISALQFLIGLAALTAAPEMLSRLYGDGPKVFSQDWLQLAATGTAGICGLAALIVFLTGRRLMAMVPALAAAVIIIPLLTAWVGPGLSQLWVSQRLAALVAKDREAFDPPPMLAGYEEPSLVFALGADTVLTDGRGPRNWAQTKADSRWWRIRKGRAFWPGWPSWRTVRRPSTICQVTIIRMAGPCM